MCPRKCPKGLKFGGIHALAISLYAHTIRKKLCGFDPTVIAYG